MAIKKTDNTPQNVLKQTTQMRMWVIIGGISALISVICKVLSSGYLEPFDFGQAALGVVCLGYAISLSKKIKQLRHSNKQQDNRGKFNLPLANSYCTRASATACPNCQTAIA